jgi:hypothetical protein
MKYLKRTLFVIFSLFSLFIIYIEFSGRFILNENDRRLITSYIRNSSKLPENFTDFYNTVYPNSLSGNSWEWLFSGLLNPNTSRRKECPCMQMSYRIFPSLEIKYKSSIDYFLVARYLEHQYSQKECLNFNFNKFDFLENRKGTEKVSMSLFNKNIENLHPIEMAEILALYEQPVRNNRLRNPERAKERTQYFYHLYSENLKK